MTDLTKKEFHYELDKIKEQMAEKTAENMKFAEKIAVNAKKGYEVATWDGCDEKVVKSLDGIDKKGFVKASSGEGGGGASGTTALTSFVTPPSQVYSRVQMQSMPSFFCDKVPLLSAPKPEIKLWSRDLDTFFNEDFDAQAEDVEPPVRYLKTSTKTIKTEKFEDAVAVKDDTLDAEDMSLNDSNQVASEALANRFMLKKERLAIDTILADASWQDSSRSINNVASANWSVNQSNALDPIQQVWAANTDVGATGYRFNQAIISQDVIDSLMVSDEIRALMNTDVNPDRPLTAASMAALAALFNVNVIHVAGAVSTKGPREISGEKTRDYMSKGVALFYYAPASLTRNSITSILKFGWVRPGFTNEGTRIKMIREEKKDSWLWKGTMHNSFHVDEPALGYKFNVTV